MRQGQKICLCYWQLTCGMPCICTMCRKLTDLPLCTILYCREQMSFVTKNVGRLWQFLRNAWLLPKIFWRKLLITLKKVVTYFLLSGLLPNHVKRKKKIPSESFLANFKISSLQVPLNFMVKLLVFLFLAKWNWLSSSFHLKMIQ